MIPIQRIKLEEVCHLSCSCCNRKN